MARLPRESRGGDPLPAGTHCRIDLGTARRYFSPWDELGALVQRCASVEVAGADPEAIEAVCRELNTVASAGTRPA
ncbi:hypothetical protein [Streptomyces sp. IBSBF 2435]|uniref:hypothetical protein n=1 Tax=Streptomyces sp. IBSBF 2435 TaxID=2903531 RepID=UPI002FDC6C63